VYDENMPERATAQTSKETEITALSSSYPKITSRIRKEAKMILKDPSPYFILKK
jgi:hypothetical protein